VKNINILVQVHKNVPVEINGDRYRLEHVMNNLLSNAIKFSPDHSDICLSLSYETKVQDSVTFAVRDYGPGISDEDKKQLFQPFMQVRPGELQKGLGSGLGLSICKNMIELHKGKIDCVSIVRSDIDDDNIIKGGTEFYFTILNKIQNNNNNNLNNIVTTSTTMIDPISSSSSSSSSTCMVGIMSSEMISRIIEYNDTVNKEKSSSLYNDVYKSSSGTSSSSSSGVKRDKRNDDGTSI